MAQLSRPNAAKFLLINEKAMQSCVGDTVTALMVAAVQLLANPEPRPEPRVSGTSTRFRMHDQRIADATGLGLYTVGRKKHWLMEIGALLPQGRQDGARNGRYSRWFMLNYSLIPSRNGHCFRLWRDHHFAVGGDYAAAILLAVYESWFCYQGRTALPKVTELERASGLCRSTIAAKHQKLVNLGLLVRSGRRYSLHGENLQEQIKAFYSGGGAVGGVTPDASLGAVSTRREQHPGGPSVPAETLSLVQSYLAAMQFRVGEPLSDEVAKIVARMYRSRDVDLSRLRGSLNRIEQRMRKGTVVRTWRYVVRALRLELDSQSPKPPRRGEQVQPAPIGPGLAEVTEPEHPLERDRAEEEMGFEIGVSDPRTASKGWMSMRDIIAEMRERDPKLADLLNPELIGGGSDVKKK